MLSKITNALTLLICSMVILYGCKKDNGPQATTTKSYTSKMGGVRTWHRNYYYKANGRSFPKPIDTLYVYSDTSFALNIINDSTISFRSSIYNPIDTFPYKTTDTGRQVYLFGDALGYGYGRGNGFAYYYNKDSIVYFSDDVHGTSDIWEKRYRCYTY